ncbi:MAG: CvpA family protein [Burkholderiales bacterium]|nr:CvpA family protein [Burkholderiales bacterium]
MSTLQLTNYDVFFLIIIGGSTILAAIKGGVAQLLSTSIWFIALFVTKNYNSKIEEYIPSVINNEMLRTLVTYIIAFLLVAVFITIIKVIFHSVIKSFGLSGLNIAIGGLFGFIRGAIICSIIIIIIEMFGMDKEHSWNNALISPIIRPIVSTLISNVDSIKDIGASVKL